ncbi:ATP-dependent DNA helicase RecG [Candidatus Bipolaricaulota bacterium]|nr:ATP-dependent DNA helicase RecG [Candidatus Bipolaricaulota bacterium]
MPTIERGGARRALVARVLSLEREKGFADTAVLGGLERFVSRHVPEARPLIAGYAQLDPPSRAKAVERVERWLADPSSARPREPLAAIPVSRLPGVGKRRAELLGRLGIETVEDLLTFFPRRLEDRSQLRPIGEVRDGETVLVRGAVRAKSRVKVRRGLELIKVAMDDGTGFLFAIWFNQPWLWDQIVQGERYALYGKAQLRYGELQLENPVWEREGTDVQTGRWVPVYPATEGLTQPVLRGLIQHALAEVADRVGDVVPQEIRERQALPTRREAISRIHAPRDPHDFERARRALAFEELLLLQVGILRCRAPAATPGRSLVPDRRFLDRFVGSLPFALTPSQWRALEEIERDLASPVPMLRLLQGDVGSGKTAVAAASCVLTVSAGAQAAIMAPTEILAEQHHLVLQELLAGLPVRVGYLAGGIGRRERQAMLDAIAGGELDVVVGTHALIQEGVAFRDLGLAVIDEQHRFGVVQRAALEAKGAGTNILVMSATPIPRTVVLTLYGDFTVSVLDEMPVSRGRVRTEWLSLSRREDVYREVAGWLARGEKGYVVFPLVAESEELDLRAASEGCDELQKRFPGHRVALLHGRMPSEDKRRTMAAFRAGAVQLLVATTVVEVGLDVPDASFLVIEHADRLGLAQLHQLRGRIGRKGQDAICYALADPTTDEARQRLSAFRDLTDGFKIAEADLRIRGPGDLLGTEQSGFVSQLRAADLTRDLGLLEKARVEALRLVADGVPDDLAREVERRFGEALSLLGV